MRLDQPELLARLADEYVVGTLMGAARRRFERLCGTNSAAIAAVRTAEDRLLPLSLSLQPVTPAAATWASILQQTGGAKARRDRPRSSWPVALAAVVAMTALGLAWFVLQRAPEPFANASVTTPDGAPLWTVEAYTDGSRLDVSARGTIPREPGRSFELWALPDGGAPVSLGLLPEAGRISRDLTAAQRLALRSTLKVAVSLEPQGGSRTGAPTGPVLYVVPLNRTG